LIGRFATENKHLGYTGSFVPPRQEVVDIVNAVFTPTREEVAEWTAVLPALEAARAEGTVVEVIDGRMYDVAGIARVRDQLDLAARLGLV
jgi:citrate lyase beta subunit